MLFQKVADFFFLRVGGNLVPGYSQNLIKKQETSPSSLAR